MTTPQELSPLEQLKEFLDEKLVETWKDYGAEDAFEYKCDVSTLKPSDVNYLYGLMQDINEGIEDGIASPQEKKEWGCPR